MASGAVRELITKIKFQIDKASESKAKSTMQELKRQLNNFAKNPTKAKIGIDTTRATTALQGIKTQLNSLQGKTVTTYVQTKQKGASASAVAKGGGKGSGNGGNALADNAGTLAATGAAMVAPLAFPIKTAMEFEAALSSVQAKLGLTKDEMKGVAAEAEKLGAETKFSSVEVLHAADYLAQAGWKEQEIRAGLKDMLQLAIAGDMDLARTADIVSDGLTALNMTAKDTAHFNDIMATAASNSNTNISIMGETFKQLLPVAGALGYSIDDVGLAIELMADKGLKGERAGSSLVAVLNGLAKPTKEASAVIEQLGVKMFDETTKKALPLKSVIEQLRNSFKGLTDEQKQTYASTIAGVDGMKGLLDIVGATDDRYNQFVGTIQNADGATDRMAKTMHDNAQGAMQDLMSALQGLAKTIGDNFLAAVRDCTVGITNFVQAFGKFAKENPKLVGGIAAAVAIIGTLLVALGGVGLAVSAIGTAISALAPIFTAVGGVLSAGFAPVLAVIAAIAAAIYFVGEYWQQIVAWFQPGIDAMNEGLELFRQAWENLQPFITAIMPLLKAIATIVGVVIVGNIWVLFRVASVVFNAIARLINWIAGLLGGLGETIQWLAGGLAGLIDKAAQFIGMKGQIEGVNSSITQKWAERAMGGNTNTQNINVGSINVPTAADVGAGIGSLATTPTYFDYQ